MTSDRAKIEEQLSQVAIDVRELGDQVADGEIDAETADRLRSGYEDEAAVLTARLREPLDDGPGPTADGRSRSRLIAGAAFLGLAMIAVVLIAVFSLEDRGPGGNAAEGVTSDVIGGEGTDLSQVSTEEMEAVVAANPGVIGMRLALAGRYFDAGDFGKALPHYMTVLEAEQHPEALTNVGWMTHLSGRSDIALSYLERALEIEPDYPLAYWFLGNVRATIGDRPGAIDALTRLLAYDALSAGVRADVEGLLASLQEGG